MRNISKAVGAAFLALSLLMAGCGKKGQSDSPSPTPVSENIKVQSIGFRLSEQEVYVDHYARILDFEVLPRDATNKEVAWTISDPEIGYFENDLVHFTKSGEATITCSATDGSNVSKSVAVSVIGLEKPNAIVAPQKMSYLIGLPFRPEVSFLPAVDVVDQRYSIEIPEEASDVLSVDENGCLIGLKEGRVTIQIVSLSNPSLRARIEVLVETDYISAFKTPVEGAMGYAYHENLDGRDSVFELRSPVSEAHEWPERVIELPKPMNLGKHKILLDMKNVAGDNWAALRLLNEDRGTIKEYNLEDADWVNPLIKERHSDGWITFEIPEDDTLKADICYISLFVHTYPELGTETVKYFDNLTILEIMPQQIIVRDNMEIDLVDFFQLEVSFLPQESTYHEYGIRLLGDAEEYIELDGILLKGKKIGSAQIEVYCTADPSIKQIVTVNIVEKVTNPKATFLPKDRDVNQSLSQPINLSDLEHKALAFDFRLDENGRKEFALLGDYNFWHNVSDRICVSRFGEAVSSNVGTVTANPLDPRWFTLTINEYNLRGDGRASATSIDFVYGAGAYQTANGYIDFTSFRIVDPLQRDEEAIMTYRDGEDIYKNDVWMRYTVAKLSQGALAFDFLLKGEGDFTFSVLNHESVVVSEIVIHQNQKGEVTSDRGLIKAANNRWMTIVINYDEFLGDTHNWEINTFVGNVDSLVSVSIDWSSLRLVPAYERQGE